MATDASPTGDLLAAAVPTGPVDEPDPTGSVRPLTSPALLASVGIYAAAAGHAVAALVHLSHGWNVTAFFLVVAAAQVVVAGRVGRGTAGAGLLVAVLLGTLGLVLLYVASRTMNLPFGGVHTVHNDRPQDPDLLGTTVVLAELVTLATAPALLPDALRRWSTTAMLLVGVGMWTAWATGVV